MDSNFLPWAQSWFRPEPQEQLLYYLLLALFSLALLLLYRQKPRIITSRSALPWSWWELPLLLLILSVVFLNPNFRSTFGRLADYSDYSQFLHHNIFLGAINQVAQGKLPLVNLDHPYGILIVIFPALVFKLLPLSYANFYIYLTAIHFIYYFLLYLLLRRLTRHRLFSLLGLILIARLVFLKPWTGHDPLSIPNVTSFRFFWDAPLFLALAHSSWLALPINFLALLYNPETGLNLTLATGVFLLFSRHYHFLPWLLLTIILAPVFYSIFTLVISHQLPHWDQFFFHARVSLQGFGTLPLPRFGTYWLVLAVYFSGLFSLTSRPRPIIAALVTYGLLAFSYYLGFSETEHLLAVSIPALVLALIILHRLFSGRFASLILSLALVWLIGHSWPRLAALYQSRYQPPSAGFHWTYPGTGFILTDVPQTDFVTAAEAIKSRLPPNHTAVIISRYDTLLLTLAQRASATDYYHQDLQILTFSQLDRLTRQAIAAQPEYVFADPIDKQSPIGQLIFQKLQNQLQWESTAGILDIYRWKDHAI